MFDMGLKTLIAIALSVASGIILIILGCVLGKSWYLLLPTSLFGVAVMPRSVYNRTLQLEPDEAWPKLTHFTISTIFVSAIGLTLSFYHAGIIKLLSLELAIPGGSLIFFALYYYYVRLANIPEGDE